MIHNSGSWKRGLWNIFPTEARYLLHRYLLHGWKDLVCYYCINCIRTFIHVPDPLSSLLVWSNKQQIYWRSLSMIVIKTIFFFTRKTCSPSCHFQMVQHPKRWRYIPHSSFWLNTPSLLWFWALTPNGQR